jgi:hypothetical protein
MSTYGSLSASAIATAACTCQVLNNTTAQNCTDLGGVLLQNGSCILCESANVINLAAQEPTLMHVAGVAPILAGGFMLSNMGVHAVRLVLVEILNWWRK